MILLINASNISKGGAIQVALSFIQECVHFNENEYHVFLSPTISSKFNSSEYPGNFHFHFLGSSPSSLLYGLYIINRLKKLEKSIKPDCVLTIFGPSYWTPKFPHLSGYAKGYYLYPESPFFKKIGLVVKFKLCLLKWIHHYFFKRNSNYYFVESEDAKNRLASFLCICKEDIFMISNTYHSAFNLEIVGDLILPPKEMDEIRLFSISSFYPHKNLEIIKDVVSELKKKSKLKFVFFLTISPVLYESKFRLFKENIINLGPVPIELCPKIYKECDFLFLPSLVEIFTASYAEAMKMGKPILTSDLSFAHDICGPAAKYFDPLNQEDIANKIIDLTMNKDLQNELIRRGKIRLIDFETPSSRAEKLIAICQNLKEQKLN